MSQEKSLVVVDRRGNVAQQDSEPTSALATIPTPADLLRIAVNQHADVDKLEKLMDLQIRWEANEARKAFTRAMSAFKAECPSMLRDGVVDYVNKKGQRVHYRHPTLCNISEVVNPILSKHGLSITFDSNQTKDGITITCEVMHVDGHVLRRSLSGPSDNSGNKNAIQAICSTATYLSRYTEMLALGLASEDIKDDDGRGAPLQSEIDCVQEKRPEKPQQQQSQRPRQQQSGEQILEADRMHDRRVQRVVAKFSANYAVIQSDIENFLSGENEPPLPAAEWRDGDFEKLTAVHKELCKIPAGPARVKAVCAKFGLPSSAMEG